MGRKKKTAKKPKAEEAPPEDEPQVDDPFDGDEAEDEAAARSEVEDESEPEESEAEVADDNVDDEDDEDEEAPAAPPDRPTVTFAEKHAQKRGEKPKTGDVKKPKTVAWLETVEYTADDIEAVDYYEMAGVSVITMSDGKKFDVTD